MTHIKCIFVVGLVVLSGTVEAVCPSVPTISRFSISADGKEVTDLKTQMIWARCSVGQTWDGNTCTGTIAVFTHEQSLQYAKVQNGWRLPNVRELSSLMDRGCVEPAIDAAAFPNQIYKKYWSSTPDVRNTNLVWYVDLIWGGVNSISRGDTLAVRLVRTN